MIREPMLAAKMPNMDALIVKMKFPMMASRKLDGIRAIVSNHEGINRLYSRKLKLIPNHHCQLLFGDGRLIYMDGELIVGPANAEDVFNKTTSGVMSMDGRPPVGYYVFDDWSDTRLPFDTRCEVTSMRVRAHEKHFPIYHVEHTLVRNGDDVRAFHDAAILAGYEGSMYRHPKSPYKEGRATANSSWLFKCKEWEDAEGIVTDLVELQHNANDAETNELGRTKRSHHQLNMVPMGTLGAFVLLTPDGRTFKVGGGPGLTAAMRQHFWDIRASLIGRTVKYSFLKVGVKVLPRHPQFLGFRED